MSNLCILKFKSKSLKYWLVSDRRQGLVTAGAVTSISKPEEFLPLSYTVLKYIKGPHLRLKKDLALIPAVFFITGAKPVVSRMGLSAPGIQPTVSPSVFMTQNLNRISQNHPGWKRTSVSSAFFFSIYEWRCFFLLIKIFKIRLRSLFVNTQLKPRPIAFWHFVPYFLIMWILFWTVLSF